MSKSERENLSRLKIKRKGVQKYVGRVKEHGCIERRHSSFYIGLYGQNWVNFMEPYKDLVTNLIKISRNKRPFYKRGLRAMEIPVGVVPGLNPLGIDNFRGRTFQPVRG